MFIQLNILRKLKKLIFFTILLLTPLSNSLSNNINDDKVHKIIEDVNKKYDYIRTANISGKVSYNLPKNKKIKLYKKYEIKRDSKIHITIYIFLRFKVAEFISDGIRVQYKRIKRKVKNRDISEFNLNIFNKYLDLDLTVKELNNMLLGLNLERFDKNLYQYKIKDSYLYVLQNKLTSKIDLKTKEIVEIIIDDKREAKIAYSEFKTVKIDKSTKNSVNTNYNVLIPRRISLTTPTFSMKIKHQNAIIINKKIENRKLLISE